MYHAIVKQKIRRVFRELSRGDASHMVDGLARSFTYRFAGDSSLGGTRTTHASMLQWWQRVFRLLPGATFEPLVIVVEGTPWDTHVMTHVRVRAQIRGALGEPHSKQDYENEFMQWMHLRWGKITSVTTLEDTVVLARVLDTLRALGVSEAGAPPLEDRQY
jgi:ketosteroid isomerase-like protein